MPRTVREGHPVSYARIGAVSVGISACLIGGCTASGVHVGAPEPISAHIDPRSPGIWTNPDPEPFFPDSVPVFAGADSLVVRDLEWIFRDYYRDFRAPDRYADVRCDPDDGDVCWTDPVDACRGEACHQPHDRILFVERLAAVAERHRGSPTGRLQAVYAAVRFSPVVSTEVAWRLVERCGELWQCPLARGYVEARLGEIDEAAAAFRATMPAVPDTIRCRLEDLSALLPVEFRRPYAGLRCDERTEFNARVWWYSDPLFSDRLNDRHVEHLARQVEALLMEQTRPLIGWSEFLPSGHARIMRRGQPDSWGSGVGETRSMAGSANHFVPERFPWTGLDGPVEYRLRAQREDERYTRPGPIVRQLPHVVARFLEGDSLVVAVVSEVPLDSIEDRSGTKVHFVASPEPGTVRTLVPTGVSARASFLATLPGEPHLTGIEVVGPEYVGRSRFPVLPLRPDTAAAVISDLLLFRAVGAELPETRQDAMVRMLSRTVVERGEPLGIYWEAYDVPPGPVSFELWVDGEEGGLFSRLGRAVGLVGDPREGRLEWSEEVGEAVFQRSITVETANLDPGEYTVTVRMSGSGGTSLERSVTFRISDD